MHERYDGAMSLPRIAAVFTMCLLLASAGARAVTQATVIELLHKDLRQQRNVAPTFAEP